MSVIVTDMEMPSGCWCCEFSETWNNESSLCKRKPMESPVGNYEKRPLWCPLKEQEAIFANLVVDWLREIALNNFDCNRDMTFLDAVEDIRDRALYGLKQYFIDRQDRR